MKKIIAVIIALNFLICPSFASSTEEMQRRIDSMYKEYLKQIEIENRMKFIGETDLKTEPKADKSEEFSSEEKRVFSKINVVCNDVPGINKKEVDKIIAPYQNAECGIEEINSIISKVQDFYAAKGYALARAYIDGSMMDEDVLTVVVKEGIIENIIFKKKNGKEYKKVSSALQRFSFYPFAKGEYLNVGDLDQGIEQMNRLNSNNPSMQSIPGSDEGYSIVEVTNNPSKRFKLSVGADNSGDEQNGKYKGNASISADNLLMLNDNFYFNYSRNIDGNDKDKESNSYFASLSIPFGYFTFMTSYFNSDYNSRVGSSQGSKYVSDGSTKNINSSLEMVIKRAQGYKVSAGSEFALKDTVNNISGEVLNTSSRKLTILTGFLTVSSYFGSANLYSKLSYSRGLDCFDAVKNSVENDLPQGQFDSYSLYAQLSVPFKIPFLKLQSLYSLVLNSQYSPDILYGSEQISLGGEHSIRGFQSGNVSGDSGVYLRNDLKWRLSDIFKREGIFKILACTSLNTFVDYGYAKHTIYSKDYRLAGAGAGLSYGMKYFNASGTWSRSIYNVSDLKDEKDVFYFKMEGSIYF